MNLTERLSKIYDIIKKEDFRKNTGRANEVGYYIFEYPEQKEIEVRNHINYLKNNHRSTEGFELIEYDLFEIMIQYIKEKGYLESCIQIEENDKIDFLISGIAQLLKLDANVDYFTEYIEKHTPENSVVFITGIGKVYPFARSHTILNKLHQNIDNVPMILFFPGKWDGQKLKLFSEIDDGNYYRAFPLIN